MRFTVESWDPSYGGSLEVAELPAADEVVDASLEVALEQWAPVIPAAAIDAAPVVTFVDGVRRIDARVWISNDGTSRPGVCATVAAGAVRADGKAQVVVAEVHRGLYAMPEGAADIVTKYGTYELEACAADDPESLYLAIHGRMTDLEKQVSATVAPDGLLILDGPLRGRNAPNSVGYVKSQHVRYLDEDQHRTLGLLGSGERSPVFLIGGRFRRYSWYLRLPGPQTHPLAGVVRCEMPAQSVINDAVQLADMVALTLPRFASEPHKDSRAPQNLYPIAGLETELRRRLGDPQLMERSLRVASH